MPLPVGATARPCSNSFGALEPVRRQPRRQSSGYRYHHLFADVLRAHLLDERPDEVTELHRNAARWYGAAGEPVAAVRHALAAGDIEQAADLVERSVIELLRQRQEATVRGWLDDIPYDVVRRRPVLAVGFIGALMSRGDFETVEDRLNDLERLLADPVDAVVLEEADLARVPGAMETYRAALALIAGDPAGTVTHADLAIAKAAPGDDLTIPPRRPWRGSRILGKRRSGGGTSRLLGRGKGLERAGNISDVLGCSITLGDIRLTQGRLGDALRSYEDALRLAAAHEVGGPLRGTADMVLGLARDRL